jgi:hypothetical protein
VLKELIPLLQITIVDFAEYERLEAEKSTQQVK